MSMIEAANVARGRWPGILQALGVDAKFLRVGVKGPCPLCGGKDRYEFEDDLNGKWKCNQCAPCPGKDGFDLLKGLYSWDFKRAAAEVRRVVGGAPLSTEKKAERTDEDKMKALRYVLGGAVPITPGTPAHTYLTARCGDLEGILGDLRAHPGLRYSREDPGLYPGLLAPMRYPDGKIASVHRTFLSPRGEKAAVESVRKIMSAHPLEGSAVRLGHNLGREAPIPERLGIAEGLETALSAGRLFGLPVWSCISAYGIRNWAPPEGVRSVVIFGDNDSHKNMDGQAAAFEKGKALSLKGFDVEVRIPTEAGWDWNDVWRNRHEEVA